MPDDYMSDYKTKAIKHENNSLYWLSIKYKIPMERILYLCDMDNQNRIAVLDEPMLPLITSDDPMDSDVYCPNCRNTVSGGWPLEHDAELALYQCPHCGQSVNPYKTETRKTTPCQDPGETEPAETIIEFWRKDQYEGCIIDFFDKNGNPVDDLDYPDTTKVLSVKNMGTRHGSTYYHTTLDVEQKRR